MTACPTPWKASYRTKSSAGHVLRLHINRLRVKRKNTHGLITYRCDCSDWHLGNTDSFAERGRRRLRALRERRRAA